MSIPRTAVKHPVTTTMVFAAFSILGVISLGRIGQELFPEINLPGILAVVVNPGVGPYEMESGITRRIEDAAAGINGVDGITSTSLESVSQVNINFVSGTDIDAAIIDVREAINGVWETLPAGTERPVLFKFSASMLPSLRLNVYAQTEGIDIRGLSQDQIIPALERIPGVAQAQLFGGTEVAVLVRLNLDAVGRSGIPITQIMQAFQNENVSLPGGNVNVDGRNIVFRTVGEFQSIEDIEYVLIGMSNDVPVYIRDVATVEYAARLQTEVVRAGDAQGVLINIRKQPGYNTVQVNEAVLARIESLRAELPRSIRFGVQEDQALQVKQSIGGVTEAAWQGGLLAVVVLLFFLRNLRSTFIISLVIPLSVVATFSLIDFGGMTLNVTSLMGITLAIGMFVDNAIVVLESIYRKLLTGLDRETAAIEGAEEVAMAITASTLTTMAVFLPMLFVDGLAGILFQDLSLTISFSLAISLVAALAIIPVLCAKFLKINPQAVARLNLNRNLHHELSLADVEVVSRFAPVNAVGKAIQAVLRALDNGYEAVVGWCLDHVAAVLAFAVLTLAVSVGSILLLGMEFLPEADDGIFSVHLETRVGSTLDFTTEKVVQIEQLVRSIAGDGITTMSSRIGDGGSNQARVSVRLAPKDERALSIWDIVNKLDEQIVDTVYDVDYNIVIEGMSALASSTTGISSPIVIRVTGNDIERMYEYSREMAATINGTPGTRNVRISHSTGKPEYQFRIKRREALSLGISPMQVAATIRTAYNGFDVSRFSDRGEDYDVTLILSEADRNDLERLNSLFFVNQRGTRIPLENVVEVVEAMGPIAINRVNRSRIIEVTANLTGSLSLSETMDLVMARLENLGPVPPGITREYTGSTTEMTDSFESLFFALMLAVALVYMVMASQFESFLNPLIVMFSVPFAVIGLVAALLISGTTFNILSFVGAILLVGIVVNNAIVLIDYIALLQRRGVDLRTAIIQGGRTRLKPILMTSLTTILGLLPMAVGTGPGSELRYPIGRAVVGGLVTSTAITVFLIPTILWFVEMGVKPFLRRILFVDDNRPAESARMRGPRSRRGKRTQGGATGGTTVSVQ